MNSRRRTTKVVHFFQLVYKTPRATVTAPDVEWARVCAELSQEGTIPLEDMGLYLSAGVADTDLGPRGRLELHQLAETGLMNALDPATGLIEDLPGDQQGRLLNGTVGVFAGAGNVVGVCKGRQGSAAVQSIADALNIVRQPQGAIWTLRPVMSEAELEKLTVATGATRLAVRASTRSGLLAPPPSRHGAGEVMRSFADHLGGEVVGSLDFRLEEGYADTKASTRFLNVLRGEIPWFSDAATRAQARLHTPDGFEDIDLVPERLVERFTMRPEGTRAIRFSELVHHVTDVVVEWEASGRP